MSINNVINEKKKALLAYKEKLLDDIKDCERNIDDFRANYKNNSFYDKDSSDSEDEFPFTINTGPTIPQLKLQQSMLKTCLQATQELTSLTVLESEVNVLVEEPKFTGERPVTEAGTWREVTAECRIDLVPFTITFFMHTPDRKFAPPSYRGLRVVPVKKAHETELAKSVLNSLKLPSDAVEVLRSYAAGYRSRRTTLARLANKYGNALFMEPHADGGFILKCAELLEVSWRLENKWSPVAPFHHRMKFDLEFMDEAYIKIITQAHKQLLDPAIQTDERTLLLAKIITTCLEVRGTESDLDSKPERDSNTLNRDDESEKRDSEVMAPPKTLPKKVKQKNSSIPQKRSMNDYDNDDRAKKIKTNELSNVKNSLTETNNGRKNKIAETVSEGGKKRKIDDKVGSSKNFEAGNTENSKETGNADIIINQTGKTKEKAGNTDADKETTVIKKNKNVKETANTEDDQKNNAKTKSIDKKKSKTVTNTKSKENVKETSEKENIETRTKNVNESDNNVNKQINTKIKNKAAKDNTVANKDSNSKTKNVKETNKTNKEITTKSKNQATQENSKNPKESINNKHNIIKTKPNKNKDMQENDNNTDKAKTENPKESINNENKIKSVKTINKNKERQGNDNNMDNDINSKVKNKLPKESINNENNIKSAKSKNKDKQNDNIVKESNTNLNNKHNLKDSDKNNKTKNKPVNDTETNQDIEEITKKNFNDQNIGKTKTKIIRQASSTDMNIKTKNMTNNKNENNVNTKNIDTKKSITQSKGNINSNKIAEKKNNNIANIKNNDNIIKQKTVPDANGYKEKAIKNTVIEKNALNYKVKDKISQINNRVSDKNTKENLPQKLSNNKIAKIPVNTIKSHRNSLKVQNPQKILKAGNTQLVNSGNIAKENGGKISKIPQKKLTPISEGSLKKNILRISPRKLSNFKSTSQKSLKQNVLKTTNIPRLAKKPSPKTMS